MVVKIEDYDGSVLGINPRKKELIRASTRVATLVLGPPRSGKSMGVIIPTTVLAPGACVTISVKPEIMVSTVEYRKKVGKCWWFNPGGDSFSHEDIKRIRWSPIVEVKSWYDAITIADMMAGTLEESHWSHRASQWLAVLLYSAALAGEDVEWLTRYTLDSITGLQKCISILESRLYESADNQTAKHMAENLLTRPETERDSIASTMTTIVGIYFTADAIELGRNPNFSIWEFLNSRDTLYITASTSKQKAYASVVSAFIQTIINLQYERIADLVKRGIAPLAPLSIVLDEAANIARLDLAGLASQCGGQGIALTCGYQDFAQVESIYGKNKANEIFSNFGYKLILRNVSNMETLHAIADLIGKVPHLGGTRNIGRGSHGHRAPIKFGSWMEKGDWSYNYSSTLEHILSPSDIRNMPVGKGLFIHDGAWDYINTILWVDSFYDRLRENLARLPTCTHTPDQEIVRTSVVRYIDRTNQC